MNFSSFLAGYKDFLHGFAELTAGLLELIGILIILVGTFRALWRLMRRARRNEQSINVVIGLCRALALALEFKVGAEIIHTVIIRDFKDLGILAVIILIRALLAVIIHWEIRMEEIADHMLQKKSGENASKGAEETPADARKDAPSEPD